LVKESLDLRGEVCPYTFVRAKLRLEELPLHATLIVYVDHAPAVESVPRALTAEGHEVTAVVRANTGWRIEVIKRSEHRLLRPADE
jgi:tRNA 2-thiouridine synthesizing protein A